MLLDAVENIILNESSAAFKNMHSIPQLLEGIFMTFNMMKIYERDYLTLMYPGECEDVIKIRQKFTTIHNFEGNRVTREIVNVCHWYSINLMNFANCCGAISFMNANQVIPENISNDKVLRVRLREHRNLYIAGIPELKPVQHFRNKASAHLAFSDPKDDNPATLYESMSIIPSYSEGRIRFGFLIRQSGEHKSSFADNEWSPTENFESLFHRYFNHAHKVV